MMGRTVYLWQLLVAVFVICFVFTILLVSMLLPEKIPQSALKVIIPFDNGIDLIKIR